MRKTRRRSIVGVVAATALVAGGVTGGAIAVGVAHDNEVPITGAALERATEVALEHVGEGRVTETEIDDEDAKYEVELTRPDGRQVDVHLDEDFQVVGTENDGAGDDAGEAED